MSRVVVSEGRTQVCVADRAVVDRNAVLSGATGDRLKEGSQQSLVLADSTGIPSSLLQVPLHKESAVLHILAA